MPNFRVIREQEQPSFGEQFATSFVNKMVQQIPLQIAKQKEQAAQQMVVETMYQSRKNGLSDDESLDTLMQNKQVMDTQFGQQAAMSLMNRGQNSQASFSNPSFDWQQYYQKQGLTPEQSKKAYEYKVGLGSRPRTGQKDDFSAFDKLYTKWDDEVDDSKKAIYEKELNKRYPDRMQSIREAGEKGEQLGAQSQQKLEDFLNFPQDTKRTFLDDTISTQNAQQGIANYVAHLVRNGMSQQEAQTKALNDYTQLQTAQSGTFQKYPVLNSGTQATAQEQPMAGQPAGQGQPMTATNPKTGERIISYDGGKTWQPIQ